MSDQAKKAEKRLTALLNYGGIQLDNTNSPGYLSLEYRQGDLADEIPQMRRLAKAFSDLADALEGVPEDHSNQNAAVAAIEFAFTIEEGEGMDFLRVWSEGDFETLRKEWPEAPEAVFIGADPLHPKTKNRKATKMADEN